MILNTLDDFKNKAEKIKNDNSDPDKSNKDSTMKQIFNLDNELLLLRELLLNDIKKREDFIMDLSQVVSKEKEEYFNLEVKIQKKNNVV